MNEIISALLREKASISTNDYMRVIAALKDIGYEGPVERWRSKREKIKDVLPNKVEWLVKNNVDKVTPLLVRQALNRGSIYV
ncbi:hypothetical protein ACNOYE_25115 [Nannocystaceae bacterium ST9]|jgi:hypothetical protein